MVSVIVSLERMFLLFLIFLPFTTGMTVLHLADFHLDVDYNITGVPSQMCHVNATVNQTQTLGSFGDYMCDSPLSLVEFSVQQAKNLFPNPDVVLWTGDNVPHIEGYNMDYVVNALNLTTTAIFSRFQNVKHILPTFGNHDYAPSNGFEINSGLYARTWELWKGVIDADQKSNFLKGGYYKQTIGDKTTKTATVIVLNTNLYYNENAAAAQFANKTDPGGMFTFMEQELQAAEQCKNSNCSSIVHVVAHIPPGAFEKTPNITWFRDEYNQKFLDITVRYQKTIKWMLYGHHHTDTFHLVKDDQGNTVQLSLMSPAVTPWFSSLRGAGANNPAFRVYDIDDSTHNITDIRTYYVNLTALNTGKTNFTLEYSFKNAYGVSPVNAQTMDGLLQKMKTDDTVFQKYITYNSIMWDAKLPTGEFRGAQLCSIEFSDYPRYRQCLKNGAHWGGVFFVFMVNVFVMFL